MSMFTDEDIRRMKKWSDYAHKKFNGQRLDEFYFELKLNEVDELLSRLEAAEAIAEYFANHPDSEKWWPYVQKSIEVWRKAAGKDGRR